MPDVSSTTKHTGRPSSYTEDKGIAIASLCAQGCSLKTITKMPDMPAMDTILKWLNERPEFLDHYSRACEARTHMWAEEILDLADSAEASNEAVNKAKLQIFARQWLAGKHHPRKFGDRVQQVHTGADGGAVKVEQISPLEEIEDRLKRLSERSEPQVEPKATIN